MCRLMEQNQSFSVEAVAIRIGFEGMTISTIKKGAFYQPDDACCKMFIRWLNGEMGLKQPTWYNLIQCLEETEIEEFSSLIRDIKEAIMLKGGSYIYICSTDNSVSTCTAAVHAEWYLN